MKQPKPVMESSFWLDRLLSALAQDRGLFTAIYDTSPETWTEIQEATKSIISGVSGRVLDAGCGYGALIEVLPEVVKYTGVDSSPHLIQVGKIRYPAFTFVKAELTSLPFEDGYFDWVVCRSIRRMLVEETDAWPSVERELSRVGKKIIVIEYDNGFQWEILK